MTNFDKAQYYKSLFLEVQKVLTYPSIGPTNKKLAEGLKSAFHSKALNYWNEAQKDSNGKTPKH